MPFLSKIRPFAVAAALLPLLGAVSPATAQSVAPDSAILSMIKARVDGGWHASIAVGVIDADGRRRVVTYGTGAGGKAVDGNSVYEIGSITKTFTATLLADMVRRGELALDDPVAKFLPAGTVVPERGGKRITLLDLSTQSSALPRMPSNFAPKDNGNPYPDYDAAHLYDFLRGYTLPRDIGATFEYSNLGVSLLGHALALKAGKPYETVMRERILDPLGMRDTRITLTPALRDRVAPGHEPYGDVVPNWDFDVMAPAGALRSTVNDMLRYLAANLDSTSRPLGAAMRDAHMPRRPAGAMKIGLNWLVLDANGHAITWHNGGTGGYRTFAGFDAARKIAVVVLSSTATGVDDIGMHLLDEKRPLQTPPALRKAIVVAPSVLDRFVGEYELAPTFHIVVSRDGEALFARPTGQEKFRIWPESETAFFVKAVDAQVTFTADSTGAVTGLVLHQNGAHTPGKKK